MGDRSLPVIVGVDGTETALQAARWAGAVAGRFGAPLHLVHVMRDVDQALLEITAAEQADAGAYPRQVGRAILDRAADAVRAEFGAVHISRTLSRTSAHKVFTELSRRARLVVLACADVSPGGALLVGSTTLAVATHSACPVVAWRGDVVSPTDQRIVVGVDDDHSSGVALETAFAFADHFGVGLTAVYAWSPRHAAGPVGIPYLVDWDAIEAAARQRLSEILAPQIEHHRHVDVMVAIETGTASHALLCHAAGAQLIVVGNRGRGRLASLLLGSTGLNLLHHSPVPVVMCRASDVQG